MRTTYTTHTQKKRSFAASVPFLSLSYTQGNNAQQTGSSTFQTFLDNITQGNTIGSLSELRAQLGSTSFYLPNLQPAPHPKSQNPSIPKTAFRRRLNSAVAATCSHSSSSRRQSMGGLPSALLSRSVPLVSVLASPRRDIWPGKAPRRVIVIKTPPSCA